MSFTNWLADRLGLSSPPSCRRKLPTVQRRFRPTLEALEDRWVPSTLIVNSTADSGPGSLRAEIAAAHRGDSIVFSNSTANGAVNFYDSTVHTITLTSGELLIKQNITITGPGADLLTISGNKASRVFELNLKTKPQVTLSGLTISNGSAPGQSTASIYNGGGILNEGTLTVTNCTISHNSAPFGAGILNDDGATLTISDSELSYNTGRTLGDNGSGGGAIANYGTLIIHHSKLWYNSAGGGGAIYTIIGAVTIDDHSVLYHNTATLAGGGAIDGWVGLNSAWTINDSTLSDNSAHQGGAILFAAGTLNITGSTLSGHSAYQGRAI